MALVLAAVYFIALFLPWFETISGWALRAGDDAGLLALAVVLVELLRRTGEWVSRASDLLALCLTAATGIMGVTTFVTFRWGSGATVSFSTFKYGAWIGLAAAILLIVVAVLQLLRSTPTGSVSARAVPDRNIALELVRVTEAGAMAAARWIGRGEKESADRAAVDAMRFVLDSVSMRGVVVIGEGEKDEAPMLFNGEEVGNGQGPEVDVAVDPLEGTRLTAFGQPNAIAVIAVAERGTMLFPGAAFYMEKIAVGPDAIDAIDIERSPTENVVAVAEALGKTPREVDVVVLERERHEDLIAELRDAGARVRLVRDGDVAPAIAAAQPGTGVDMLYGIGGTPEGVISAAALKCVGGGIQGRLWPRSDDERQKLLDEGLDPARVLRTDDLVSGEDVFVAATGVTTGSLLDGVKYTPGGAVTDSIVMRSRSGTVRRVVAQQSLAKLSALTGFEYT